MILRIVSFATMGAALAVVVVGFDQHDLAAVGLGAMGLLFLAMSLVSP